MSGPSASRELDGLEIPINLDTLDTAANKFASLLPAKIVSELPVAIPNEQLVTLYFGRVQVSSTGSPSFAENSGSSGAGAGTTSPSSSAPHRQHGQRRLHREHGHRVEPGAPSPATPARAPGRPPRARARAPVGPRRACPRRPPPSATRSRGSAPSLVLLGLLAAAPLAYLYKRADDLTDALGTTCSEGDPLMERFNVTPDELNDFGGFG